MPAAPSSMIGLNRVLSYNLSSFPCLRRNLELCCVVSLCCVSLLHHLIIFVRRRRGSLPPGGKAATSRVSLQLIRCFHTQSTHKHPFLPISSPEAGNQESQFGFADSWRHLSFDLQNQQFPSDGPAVSAAVLPQTLPTGGSGARWHEGSIVISSPSNNLRLNWTTTYKFARRI